MSEKVSFNLPDRRIKISVGFVDSEPEMTIVGEMSLRPKYSLSNIDILWRVMRDFTVALQNGEYTHKQDYLSTSSATLEKND